MIDHGVKGSQAIRGLTVPVTQDNQIEHLGDDVVHGSLDQIFPICQFAARVSNIPVTVAQVRNKRW